MRRWWLRQHDGSFGGRCTSRWRRGGGGVVRNPTLQGEIILRLTIEPDGSVSLCHLHGSNMNAPDLAAQVVERLKTFSVGAKVAPPVTIIYPINFFPLLPEDAI
jgi:hypothetical protein